MDIRRFPSSRKFPHFNQKEMKENLGKNGIEYIWLGEKLGGFRQGGYPAWMKTLEFNQGLKEIEDISQKKKVAIMCAERYFGRCHRRFLLEALASRGWQIEHII